VGLRRAGVALLLAFGVAAAAASAVSGAGPLQPSQRECFAVAGAAGDVAVVNLTPVLATGPGNGLLVSSDVAAPPVASNVNFGPGTIDPNVAFAPIGADGQVCYVNSTHSQVDVIADHLGTIDRDVFTPANAQATPERVADTRDWRPDVYLNYHGSEALLGDTDSQWPFVRANLDGFWGYWSSTTDTNAGIDMAVELTRKVTGRKLVLEQDISIGYQCRGLNADNFHGGGGGIESRAPDIEFERTAVAIYAGEIPDCWGPLGGVQGILNQYQPAGYDQVWSLWQASNVMNIEEGDDFPRVRPGSSGEMALQQASGLVIECHMTDCIHPAIRDEFFRVIAEAHARGQSFVWFTGYHPEMGPPTGWLAKLQQTYNAIRAQGLWRPGDAVLVINYYGSYPALPERRLDGTPADTVTGILAWLLEQRGS
jgi:hypothetical protein